MHSIYHIYGKVYIVYIPYTICITFANKMTVRVFMFNPLVHLLQM